MSGERQWLRIRPRVHRAPDANKIEDRQIPPHPRATGDARSLSGHLSGIAQRAGNRVVRRYAEEQAFVAPEHVERAIDAGAGGGAPLDHSPRQKMEGAFGSDLSGVRIHSDAQADALSADLSARAFTRGSDVYFAAGEYSPNTSSGQRLLAHELTHVEQQQDGEKLNVGSASDPAEVEADAVADQVVQRLSGGAAESVAPNEAQRQPEEEEAKALLVRRQPEEEEEQTGA
jgi:hypothetical protein